MISRLYPFPSPTALVALNFLLSTRSACPLPTAAPSTANVVAVTVFRHDAHGMRRSWEVVVFCLRLRN